MKTIFNIISLVALCFLCHTSVSAEQKSPFRDYFKENIGYENKSENKSENENTQDSGGLRSAPGGPGIGEEIAPIGNGTGLIFLSGIIYIFYIHTKIQRKKMITHIDFIY
jgi:hypothetical protein